MSNNNNGKRQWTAEETIIFLRLLRRYPLLYVQGKTKSISGYTKSLIKFATDCDDAGLPYLNKDNLIARISQMRNNTYQAVRRYRDRPFDSSTITLKWFEYAYFLDTTGFIRETIAQKLESSSVCEIPLEHLWEPKEEQLEDQEEEDGGTYWYPADEETSFHETDLDQFTASLKENPVPKKRSRQSKDEPPSLRPKVVEDAAQQTSNCYLQSFMEYTKIRTNRYTAAQKRLWVDVIQVAMNDIELREEEKAAAQK